MHTNQIYKKITEYIRKITLVVQLKNSDAGFFFIKLYCRQLFCNCLFRFKNLHTNYSSCIKFQFNQLFK